MIIRSQKPEHSFTIISNEVIEDTNLDWKDLGLLVYLLSKPDNWEISLAHLAKQKRTGQDGVATAIKNLKQAGYIRMKRHSTGHVDWYVYDRPQIDSPKLDNPQGENKALISTEYKQVLNNNKSKRFVKPSLDDVAEYCASRQNTIDAEVFIDYYESVGWVVGKSKMKDWKAAVRTWERRRKTETAPSVDFDQYEGVS